MSKNNNRHKPHIILPNQPDPVFDGIHKIVLAFMTMTGSRIINMNQLVAALTQGFKLSLKMNIDQALNQGIKNAMLQYDAGIRQSLEIFFGLERKLIEEGLKKDPDMVMVPLNHDTLEVLKGRLINHLSKTRIEVNAKKAPKEEEPKKEG